MRGLTEIEQPFIYGSDGNDSYNPTSLLGGVSAPSAAAPSPTMRSENERPALWPIRDETIVAALFGEATIH